MVDSTVLATKLAAIRDAVARIREVLPATAEAFLAGRTTREVVTLNLFLALQESIALARAPTGMTRAASSATHRTASGAS